MHRPHEFLGYLADSVWLYTFGLAVQNLVGHKHVIPIFLYALLLGGIAYFLMLFAPGVWGRVGTPQFITPVAGILALGFAGLNLAPGSRIYFSERINIPMPVIVGVYAAVMLLFMGSVPAVLLCMVGAFVGYNYITLLKAGYNPGGWIYAVVDYCNNMFTPKAKKKPFNSGSYSGAPKNTTIRPVYKYPCSP